MMVSRRMFVAGTLGSAALAVVPVAARAGQVARSGLLIVDPALLTTTPPAGALVASGSDLLSVLMPMVNGITQLEAVLGQADTEMLAQLVRFQPGLRWSVQRVGAGAMTPAGVAKTAALIGIAAVR